MHKLLTMVAMAASSLLIISVTSAGDPGATNTRTSFTTTVPNFCNGDAGPVTVSGVTHVISTQLGNGDYVQRLNFHGSGTNADGTKFQLNSRGTFVTTDAPFIATIFNPDGSVLTQGRGNGVEDFSSHLIGQGPNNNHNATFTGSLIVGTFALIPPPQFRCNG
jgi:hypothetical protein